MTDTTTMQESKVLSAVPQEEIGINKRYEEDEFCSIDGRLFAVRLKDVSDDSGELITEKEYIPVANFSPWIARVVTYTDGVSTEKKYAICGLVEGKKELPEIIVDGDELLSFGWLTNKWDTACNICTPSGGNKDKLRYALQSTTKYAEKETVYATMGWHKTEDGWQYLLPGHAKYKVELMGKQKNYYTEYGATDKDYAVLQGLTELDFIPKEVLQPALALAFLSPLNQFLKEAGHEPKFILFLHGRTGCMKSTVAALVLSLFGNFSNTDLPMSFQDTANSMAHSAFVAKDTLVCVDDYHPTTGSDTCDMKRLMQSLARIIGDRTERGRMQADGKARPTHPAQCNAIVTGEQLPDISESGGARLFAVELRSGAIDTALLSEVQRFAEEGVLRRVMNAYTEWLRNSYLFDREHEKKLVEGLRIAFEKYRAECRNYFAEKKIYCHGRTAEAVASLAVGYQMLTAFLYSRFSGEWTEKRQKKNMDFLTLLYALAEKQADRISIDRPTHIFLRKMFALLDGGEYNVIPANVNYNPEKYTLGYEDGSYYYLFLEKACSAVRSLCEKQGESFPISSMALAKALAEEQYIEVKKNGENTVTKRFHGRGQRVMLLKKNVARTYYYGEENA